MSTISDVILQHFHNQENKMKRDLFLGIIYEIVDADTTLSVSTRRLREKLSIPDTDSSKLLNYLFQKDYIKAINTGNTSALKKDELYRMQVEGIEYIESLKAPGAKTVFHRHLKAVYKHIDKDNLVTKDNHSYIKHEDLNIINKDDVALDIDNTNHKTKSSSPDNVAEENSNDEEHHSIFSNSDNKNFSKETINDDYITIDNDLLDHSSYSKALIDFITHENFSTPFSISIAGDWGSGKSNVLRWIENDLNNKQYETFWFNAWKYSKDEEIWASFATEITKQIVRKKGRLRLIWHRICDHASELSPTFDTFILIALIVFNVKLYEKVFELLPITVILASVSLASIWSIVKSFSLPFLKIISENKRPDYSRYTGLKKEFIDDFKSLIDFSSEKKPFVIFIDDLDRTPPPIAADIIEAISIMLEHKRCIFIFAFDPIIVNASIESKYSTIIDTLNSNPYTKGKFTGRVFIEKFFQLTINLPELSERKAEEFVDEILNYKNEIKFKTDSLNSVNSNAVLSSENHVLSEEETIVDFDEKKMEFIERFDENREVKRVAKYSTKVLPGNPRKLKRFINTFRFTAYVANRKGLLLEDNNFSLFHLGVVVITMLEFPEIYKLFVSHSSIRNLTALQESINTPVAKIDEYLLNCGINESHRNNRVGQLCTQLSAIRESQKSMYIKLMV